MLDTFNNKYWKKRFTKTFGYLLYKEKFSPRDLLNARYHYGREIDEKLYNYVTNRFHTMDVEVMWSGIAAPYSSFYEGDWNQYIDKGKDLREKALVKLLVSKGFPDSLSKDQIVEAKNEASAELLNSGYHVPINKKAIPKRIPPHIDYTDYRGVSLEDEV